MTRTSLYSRITDITEEYLGPAAERFVARQITFHLGKAPEELSPDDLPKLIQWTKVTFSLLTEDRDAIEEYIHKMEQLASDDET
jgi:hypothetical protein